MSIYDVSQPFVSAIKSATSMVVNGIVPSVRKPSEIVNEDMSEEIRNILKFAEII
jgi:4-hydroxy-tetrahydrodipicolinate synthase